MIPAPSAMFRTLCSRRGLLAPEAEYRFAPPRRWRFDYAWPEQLVALEVEGGIWTRGRHTRGRGFLGDMEKYNAAAVQGWRVVRVTPSALCASSTFKMLRALGLTVPRRFVPHTGEWLCKHGMRHGAGVHACDLCCVPVVDGAPVPNWGVK